MKLLEFLLKVRPDLDAKPLAELVDVPSTRHRPRDESFVCFLRSVEILQAAVGTMREHENPPGLNEGGARGSGRTPSACVYDLRTKCAGVRTALDIWGVTRHGDQKFPERSIREIWDFIRQTVSPAMRKAPPPEPDVVADVRAAHPRLTEFFGGATKSRQ